VRFPEPPLSTLEAYSEAMVRRNEEPADPVVDEAKLADWAMTLHVTLLMVTFLGGYWLSNMECKYLGESGFGLIVGELIAASGYTVHGCSVVENRR